jgi:hypothetical protein
MSETRDILPFQRIVGECPICHSPLLVGVRLYFTFENGKLVSNDTFVEVMESATVTCSMHCELSLKQRKPISADVERQLRLAMVDLSRKLNSN